MTTLKDKLGRTVTVGDRIAYASFHNLGMTIGTITKLGRLRAEVIAEDTSFSDRSESLLTTELIKI
jgi:hypothetical protein